MTVKTLLQLCEEEVKTGNGDREVILCVDTDTFYLLQNNFSSLVYNDSGVYDLIEELGLKEDDAIVLN